MASLEKLLVALKARYDGADGAALRALSTGGYHVHPAPAGTAYPFTTWQVPAAGSGFGSMAGDHDETTVQLSFWDKSGSPLKVVQMRDAAVTLFNRKESTMSVTPDNLVSVTTRARGGPMRDPEPGVVVCHVDIVCRVG